MTTKLQPFNLNTAATFSFTGNTSFSGANVSLGSVSNLHIAGGTADYVLKTDGTGNLSWVAQSASSEVIYSRTSITATAGQTTFTVAYNIGYIEVYYNGALLNSVDYTANNGSTVVLTDAAAVDDIVEFITYNTVEVSAVPVATFNSTNLTANLAITAGYSAVSVGPINIADGVRISIADGQKWVIL